jgi:hypothetical protein
MVAVNRALLQLKRVGQRGSPSTIGNHKSSVCTMCRMTPLLATPDCLGCVDHPGSITISNHGPGGLSPGSGFDVRQLQARTVELDYVDRRRQAT